MKCHCGNIPHMAQIPYSDKMSSQRSENSLFCLTKKFIKMIQECDDKTVDLNKVASKLGVHKRRVYDITNILTGLGMLSKWSVNSTKWIGHDIQDEKENQEYGNTKEEEILDKRILQLNKELSAISQDKTNLENAYVTYNDLQSIPSLRNKLIFSIKAPTETVMDVPKYDKGFYKMNLTSDKGNILVYYVSEE